MNLYDIYKIDFILFNLMTKFILNLYLKLLMKIYSIDL